VTFKVSGGIFLQSRLYVKGANITIDGLTAPSPGITLNNYGLFIHGVLGACDVIVRGIRVRNLMKGRDGIQIAYGAYNILIDRVSVSGGGDGNLDITKDSHDVNVAWSILAKPAGTEKNMLIKYNPSRITLHHNIFLNARQRNPQVRIDDLGRRANGTTVDMRNNLVWGWTGGYGTLIWHGPWANVVDNFYSAASGDPKRAIEVSNGARAYVSGNFSADGLTDYINARGTETEAFPAPGVDTKDPCTAALQLLANAGVTPRDEVDKKNLSAISLARCGH
jgi:pectate lyase